MADGMHCTGLWPYGMHCMAGPMADGMPYTKAALNAIRHRPMQRMPYAIGAVVHTILHRPLAVHTVRHKPMARIPYATGLRCRPSRGLCALHGRAYGA